MDYRTEAPDIIKGFLTYHETIKGHSRKTVDEYYLDLRNFFRFLKIQRGIVPRNTELDEIPISDIDLEEVSSDMFVAFYTGYIEEEGYGTRKYFAEHPQLSNKLIEELLKQKVSIIGVDFAGVRRGKEHTPMDQHCADCGVFIIENLCNLKKLLGNDSLFIANTYPMNYADMTGLPCRVVAET